MWGYCFETQCGEPGSDGRPGHLCKGVQYFFEGQVGELEVDLEGTIRAMVRVPFPIKLF